MFVAQDLPGFKQFVVKLMIQMSRDFATRSLNISEETPGLVRLDEEVEEVCIYKILKIFPKIFSLK